MSMSTAMMKRVVSTPAFRAAAKRVSMHGKTMPSAKLAERSIRVRATEAEAGSAASSSASDDQEWIPVIAPEDLPKGVRKEVRVAGQSVLLFWYRNQIYAIDSRSPAEGAYSEGFIKAKFTQDYGIVCPTTGSIFSLKDGSITEWYPTNPVLRSITPQSGNLAIYPVKLTQDAIKVSINGVTASQASTRGGADTSLENNNVFALQPAVYVEGNSSDEADGSGAVSTAATFTVALTCFGIIATAGTATALYYEDFVLLGSFWAVLLGFSGFFGYQYFQNKDN